MNDKRTNQTRTTSIAFVALLIFISVGTVPAAAAELPDYQHLYVETANSVAFDKQGNGTYLIDWTTTGGLNALHISNSNASLYGQSTTTSSTSGTFYVTDTGGRHYQDDIVLLVAVNKADGLGSLSLTINASGYNWTPTADGGAPPVEDITYRNGAVNTVFYDGNLLSGIQQVWKPGPTDVYPIYSGQDTATSDPFELMFIDLHAGTFSNCTQPDNLYHSGNVRVDYTISGLSGGSKVAFNAYAWNNLTVHPYSQGIRWTNRVNVDGESSAGASGWMVTVPEAK